MTDAETVGAVVGENLQRLRERARLTQHETARLLTRRGVPWNRSKVAAVEAGERPNVTFADVVLLANTFNVELAELFEGSGDVALSDLVTLSRPMIRDIIWGQAVLEGSDGWDPETRQDELFGMARIRTSGEGMLAANFEGIEADDALAQRLDVPQRAVIEIARELWGRTLTSERDFRVNQLDDDMAVGERQAHRGHITRELSQEIQAEVRRRGLTGDTAEEDG